MLHSKDYNDSVPNEVFDIEDSDEIAEEWLSMRFDDYETCDRCGVILKDNGKDKNCDSEIDDYMCNKCQKEFDKELEAFVTINN